MRFVLLSSLLLSLFGCGDDVGDLTDAGAADSTTDLDAGPTGLAILGFGSHAIDAVGLSTVATLDDAIRAPRDLAFHPTVDNQLWIVNDDGFVTILSDVGMETQDWSRRNGGGSQHFLSRPAALAFDDVDQFATAPETDEVTQEGSPTDFMGPTLWPTDMDLFDAGHASHLDMLHNSPNSVGIAWETGNAYWVFDGMHNSLTRYDFVEDHGPGNVDHSDGIIERFAEGQVAYVPDVSSHMVVSGGMLYVADTGNGRIGRLDIATGSPGRTIGPNYDGISTLRMMDGAVVENVVPAGTVEGLERPSGLAIRDGMIFVSDNATSRLFAFTMDGALVDWLDLSTTVAPGALMGIEFAPNGDLLFVDAVDSRILRLSPL